MRHWLQSEVVLKSGYDLTDLSIAIAVGPLWTRNCSEYIGYG